MEGSKGKEDFEMKNQSTHKALGPQVSVIQRLTEQLTMKQAISYKVDEKNKVWLQVDSRTSILVDKDCDMDQKRVHYLRKYEKATL